MFVYEPPEMFVTVNPNSDIADNYVAAAARFPEGFDFSTVDETGNLELVDDGTDSPTEGCEELNGFNPNRIAVIDRGGCTFVTKVRNAQDAGASAAIIVNYVNGSPFKMRDDGTGDDITIHLS